MRVCVYGVERGNQERDVQGGKKTKSVRKVLILNLSNAKWEVSTGKRTDE